MNHPDPTPQVGNSQPEYEHELSYIVEVKKPNPFRVSCSHCRRYIRLSLTGFHHYQTTKTTTSFFEAMAGECRGFL